VNIDFLVSKRRQYRLSNGESYRYDARQTTGAIVRSKSEFLREEYTQLDDFHEFEELKIRWQYPLRILPICLKILMLHQIVKS